VGAARVYEPRGGGVELELEHLPPLGAHLQPPALLVNREHRAELEPAAEMRDSRARADAGYGS
jgi:hypothetical protein